MSEGIIDQRQRSHEGQIGSLAAAAHELKTPLVIINQLAASLADGLYEFEPSRQQQTIQRIQLSAQRTLRIVQSLTINQRLELDEHMQLFELEPLNALQACEEAVQELLPFAAAYEQSIELESVVKPPIVIGNKELLRSIAFNLIDNAIKHGSPHSTIRIDMRRHHQFVRICVQDDGPTTLPRNLSKLAETIGQQAQPLHGRPGTSGLGLYIAAHMAKVMGGSIGLGRRSGGIDFHVDLLSSKQLSFL